MYGSDIPELLFGLKQNDTHMHGFVVTFRTLRFKSRSISEVKND